MAHPTNEPGSTAGKPSDESANTGLSSDQGTPRPVGGMGAKPAPGPTGHADERTRLVDRTSGLASVPGALATPSERRYSFHALIAMGILGFTLGRLFSR